MTAHTNFDGGYILIPRILQGLVRKDFKPLLEDALAKAPDGVVTYQIPFLERKIHLVNGPMLINHLQKKSEYFGRKGGFTEAVFPILGKYAVIALDEGPDGKHQMLRAPFEERFAAGQMRKLYGKLQEVIRQQLSLWSSTNHMINMDDLLDLSLRGFHTAAFNPGQVEFSQLQDISNKLSSGIDFILPQYFLGEWLWRRNPGYRQFDQDKIDIYLQVAKILVDTKLDDSLLGIIKSILMEGKIFTGGVTAIDSLNELIQILREAQSEPKVLKRALKLEATKTSGQKHLGVMEAIGLFLTFLQAGFDTTAGVLAGVLHELKDYPNVISAIRASLQAEDKKGQFGSVVKRVDKFFTRKYHSTWALPRMVQADLLYRAEAHILNNHTFTEAEYHFHEGDIVFFNYYSGLRAHPVWQGIDLESFVLGRVSEDVRDLSYAFGLPPSLCLGIHLAILVTDLFISEIVNYQVIESGIPEIKTVSGVMKLLGSRWQIKLIKT